MIVFLDLDGPLLDVRPRYHGLYAMLVEELGGTPLPLDEYWAQKRERVPERDLFERAVGSAHADEGARRRQELIESVEWLDRDRVWSYALPCLEMLGRFARRILVTQRTYRDRTLAEVERLGLSRGLDDVIVDRGDGTTTAKARSIREHGVSMPPRSALVGDTEVDVASARDLGVAAIAVRTGIRSDTLLARAGPDHLFDDLRSATDWLTGWWGA